MLNVILETKSGMHVIRMCEKDFAMYNRLLAALGREPNDFEIEVFGKFFNLIRR